MRTRFFLVVAFVAASPATGVLAQDTSSVCKEMSAAKDAPQLNAVLGRHSREKDLEKLRADEKASEAEQKRRAQSLVVAKAEAVKARKEWQSMASSSLADLESALAEARKPVEAHRVNVGRLTELKRLMNQGGLGAAERTGTTKEIAELEEKIAGFNKAEAEKSVAAAERAVERRRDPDKHLATVKALEQKADQAQQSYNTEKTRLAGIQNQLLATQKQQDEIQKCFGERSKALTTPAQQTPPASQATADQGAQQQVEGLLTSIQQHLDKILAIRREQAARCQPVDGLVSKAATEAQNVSKEARALSTQATAPTGGGAAPSLSAADQKAVSDARVAAQTVAQSRSRANQLMQATCNAARQVVGAARGTNVTPYVVEAQRNRALAEQEMTVTSNALQVIRNAHGAATSGGPAAGGAAILRPQVDGLIARLRSIANQPSTLRGQLPAGDWQNEDNLIRATLATVGNELRDPRLKSLPDGYPGRIHYNRRYAESLFKNLSKPEEQRSCRALLEERIAELDNSVKTAFFDIQTAQNHVAAMTPAAAGPNAKQIIEGIFNPARTTAEGTAKDTTDAVRCEAEARKVVAPATTTPPTPPAPPLPPTTGRGIKCSYTGPQGPFEIVLYDRTTCPPTAPGYASTQTPSGPPPQMMQDFSGTWADSGGSVWQISAGGASGKWQGSYGSNNVWSGPCQQAGTHQLKCTGNGTYNDADKETTYTYSATLTMGANVITYSFAITGANIRMKRQIPPYGDLQKGKIYNGTLKRAGR
jgi:hypothetical protein